MIETVENNRLMHFPISFFATVMGLSGLTIATQKMEEAIHLGHTFSTVLAILTLAVFVIIASIYTRKFMRYRQAVINEFGHPIRLHFFPAMSISLLLLGVVFLHLCTSLSFALWSLGALLHLLFTLKIVSMWIHHTHFEINHMNPSWFIPAVGNIIVPVAGVTHAPSEISWFFFSIGLGFWLILLIIFFNRAIFHHPLPDKLLPTLFILIAPPAVGFLAYFKLTQNVDPFAYVLYYFALFLLLLLIAQVKLFWRIQFFLSWWAYSFPCAAITIATFLMYQQSDKTFFLGLALILYLLLFALIGVLIWRTYQGIKAQAICVEEK